MPERVTHFGKWLKRQIENTGLSQREFCRGALVARPSLTRWLADPCPPIRGHNVARLARALNVGREVIDAKLNEAEAAHATAAA